MSLVDYSNTFRFFNGDTAAAADADEIALADFATYPNPYGTHQHGLMPNKIWQANLADLVRRLGL